MNYNSEFLQFALEQGVLRFGEFTLKSGRISPYFFNAGLFNSGAAMARLGGFYAQAIQASGLAFDMLFGPAYKGIPLAVATTIALAAEHGRDVPYAFNRKLVKDHGEGGNLVGAPLAGSVLIVDDVITAGTAVREAVTLIRSARAQPVGMAIALDRQERGRGTQSAIQEVESELGIQVLSIATLDDLLGFVQGQAALADNLHAIQAYREQYGV